MGIKGVGLSGGASLFKSLLSTPPPPSRRAGMLFVPAQKLSVIEWVYSLSSHTLRYGFSLLKSKYWYLFIYNFVCRDRGPGDFTIRYQGTYRWFREWIHLRTETEGNRKEEAYYFVLFCSVSFNLFLYVFFLHTKTEPNTSHFRYKRATDTMIQHTPEE